MPGHTCKPRRLSPGIPVVSYVAGRGDMPIASESMCASISGVEYSTDRIQGGQVAARAQRGEGRAIVLCVGRL